MLIKIKKRIEKQLPIFISWLDRSYHLNRISPLLFKRIKEYTLRNGKRVRPTLFILAYHGYAKKELPGLYTSSLSLELLHDFMLVHDDIIDKSDFRRRKPAMHVLFNKYLKKYKNIKITGEDLSIVAGDIMYAMSIHAFLAVKTDKTNKEKALKKLMEAAFYTGTGEFIELLYGSKPVKMISQSDIYQIYDLKTACYTFATPLAAGAALAGSRDEEINKLFNYGICLGRAFQIKDDILGIFADEKKIGKSVMSDLREHKKTLLIWYAYRKAGKQGKKTIEQLMSKRKYRKADLLRIRKLMLETGTVNFAEKQILRLIKKAGYLLADTRMQNKYKDALYEYSKAILSV